MEAFEKGHVLDERYEILSLLGAGGMGRVYKARQLNLDRTVAIKVPSEAVLKNADFLARFVREGQTCAKISHDNIVSIYDVHSGDLPYIVMEFVDGMPLNHFIKEEQTTLFVSDLLDIIGQVSDGLAAAHSSHIVHRDIKPANIVITRQYHRVKVMDFGIARVSDKTSLTNTGSMMGTPYYMAPEQIKGLEVSPATDLYALGCVVYFLLSGKLVFEGDVTTLIYQHISEAPKPPNVVNPALPEEVNRVVLKTLEKVPENRYESTLSFHRELCKAMRPLSQLPYTQIFSAEFIEKTVVSQQPPYPKPNGEVPTITASPPGNEVDRKLQAEVARSQSERSTDAMKRSKPAPTVAPHVFRQREMEKPAKKSWQMWALFGLFLCAVATALLFWKNQEKKGPLPTPGEAQLDTTGVRPLVLPEERDGAQVLQEPGQGPWLWTPHSPREPYRVGDFFVALFHMEDHQPNSRLYQVSLKDVHSGASLYQLRSAAERVAFPLTQPGVYLFEVRKESDPVFPPLEMTIQVLPDEAHSSPL